MDDDELRELLAHRATGVSVVDDRTVITLDDGRRLVVDGRPTPLDGGGASLVPRCAFCGAPPDDHPLFSVDNDVFICRHCTALAVRTFLENGVPLPLPLDAPEGSVDGHA